MQGTSGILSTAANPPQRIGEALGVAFGGLCFVAEWVLSSASPSSAPLRITLPVIVASTISGATTAAILRTPLGIRAGLRAGIVTALVGSSALVLLALFSGLRSAELLGIELLALLSFPPSVSLGVIGAIAATFMVNPPSLPPAAAPLASTRKPSGNLLFRIIIALSILCYLLPLLLLTRADSQSAAAPVTVAAPAIPAWHYEKPANFSSLPGAKIGLLAQKEIAGVDQSLPMAIAPDGKRFAFFTNEHGQTTLEIFDLDAFQSVATFAVPHAFTELSWSPDSQRLFFVPPKEEHLVGVVDIDNHRLIPLPIPKNKHVPEATPYWWKESEVLFPDTSDMLDLDTLQLLPIAKSPSWTALSQPERDKWLDAAPTSWRMPSNWTFEILKRVTAYDFTSPDNGEWTTQYDIAFADKDSPVSRVVADVDLRPGDQLLSASDGSKLVVVRDNVATVFYMGAMDALNTFSVALPEQEAGARLFVCPPIVNPLNGKVVGPDRDRVKAVARVIAWKDGKATCWVEQEYEPVEIGDIAGDAHDWTDDNLKLSDTDWGKIEAADTATVIPARSKTTPPENVITPSFDTPHAVATVTDMRPTFSRSVTAPEEVGASDGVAAIKDFIRAHHAKSSAGDIDGVAKDYSDSVEYFDDGVVNREFIRNDSASYHVGHKISETVLGDIAIEQLPDQTYVVRYQLVFRRASTTNDKWTGGVAAVELCVAPASGGYQITKQHAKILTKEQSQ